MRRVLALDVGDRRIGIAVSDPLGLTAQGLETYTRAIDNEAADVAHIFERFYRSDEARNHRTGGTGLGLSIAKWIVDQHNGYYSIVSREGLGTRFHVILPQEGMIVT